MKKDISDKNNSCSSKNSNNGKKSSNGSSDNNSCDSSKNSSKNSSNGSTPTRPSVAVVMCTYNGEKFLREQLDSILDQTYPISEIIIQDDRSTDGTVALLRQYEERHPNIHVFVNEQNLGFNLNFKTACMRPTADLIAISDQDDVWFKDKIERQVAAMGENNICCSTYLRGRSMETSHKVGMPYSLPALLFTSSIAGHSMLMRRDFLQRDVVWMPHFFYDWSIAVNAYFYGSRSVTRIEEPLDWHRSHDGEAALKQSLAVMPALKKRPTWQPYVKGLKAYRQLQKKPQWDQFYAYINSCTRGIDDPQFRLAHRLSALMLRRDTLSLLRLMWLCMRHRRTVYRKPSRTKGLMGRVHGFFFPFIFAYRLTAFDL